ncbi:MAG TPA: ATP-binding protein [Patescibacteria group bacterium]|nr:ATP-binding protein [Patescibacteria group bacterium]
MVIDDYMFHVGKFWYRLYWGIVVVINVLVLGGYLAGHFMPGFTQTAADFGLNDPLTPVLSGAALVYSLTLYWVMARFGQAVAGLVATMLNALVILNCLTNAGSHAAGLILVIIWIVTTALNGVYGLQILLGSALITGMYVLLQAHYQPGPVMQQSWVMLGGALAAAVLGYPFWRTQFKQGEAQQLNQLSGMLQTNQKQSAILIQSIADGVIVTNNDGQITLMNRAAANITGWPVQEATGVDVQLVLKMSKEDGTEISADEYPFKSVLIHKAFINQSLKVTSRNNSTVITSLVISPVVTQDGKVYGAVGVLRDISEQRASEKQSADFISTASHEMRTPVAAIEGYLALALNDKVSSVDSRARGFLEKAHASTQHLGQLFQDLLTSAKAEDGRLTNHPGVVEMGGFLEQLVDDLRFAAQKKGLAAEFVIGTGQTIDATKKDANEGGSSTKLLRPLYYVYADADRMREVITNLFDNACKYTDSGKVSLGLTGNEQVVQFYIRDTGNGIPAQDVPHLFQKFYRVDSSATRTIGGTGLGLFICRKIVELYKGRIWVESELGKGSTFFINLPRMNAQKAAELQAQAANNPTPAVPTA